MQKVISQDGTAIAFDQSGEGPALILVAGALTPRVAFGPLAACLAPYFRVFNYDRRGRGDSGDTLPYTLEREVEDIEALIDEAGGSAFLFGHSSGAALVLEATLLLGKKVKKIALYEAPYNDEEEAKARWREYIEKLTVALAEGRRGDGVALFMELLGTPKEQVEAMRQGPGWAQLEALGQTLAYDHTAIMGKSHTVPVERVAKIKVPALVMNGSASFPFMYETAVKLSKAIPGAELRTLEGQDHGPSGEVLTPVLVEFFVGA